MTKLAKISQRRRNQVLIDSAQDATNFRQDMVNDRQDRLDEQHTLTNLYQSVVLSIYGVLLLGLFVMSVIGYFIK